MLRRLLINEQPSFASIGYIHQQLEDGDDIDLNPGIAVECLNEFR